MGGSMKTIWVIEAGYYSDYRVVGVFSSKKNAELVLKNLKGDYEEPSISEWSLDPAVSELNAGYRLWSGTMLRDGTVERCEEQELSSYDVSASLELWRRSSAPFCKGKSVQDCLHGTVFAKDQKHAIKIFNEHRTQLIAAGKW